MNKTLTVSAELAMNAAVMEKAERVLDLRLIPEMINSAPIMGDNRFWSLMAHLSNLVLNRMRSGCDAKVGVDEFVRQSVMSSAQPPELNPYNFAEVVMFARRYGITVCDVRVKLSPCFDHHGDSFSDLCDSLPLMGRQIFTKAWKTESVADWNALIRKHAPNYPEIFNGENYIQMSLEDKITEFLVAHAGRFEELALVIKGV